MKNNKFNRNFFIDTKSMCVVLLIILIIVIIFTFLNTNIPEFNQSSSSSTCINNYNGDIQFSRRIIIKIDIANEDASKGGEIIYSNSIVPNPDPYSLVDTWNNTFIMTFSSLGDDVEWGSGDRSFIEIGPGLEDITLSELAKSYGTLPDGWTDFIDEAYEINAVMLIRGIDVKLSNLGISANKEILEKMQISLKKTIDINKKVKKLLHGTYCEMCRDIIDFTIDDFFFYVDPDNISEDNVRLNIRKLLLESLGTQVIKTTDYDDIKDTAERNMERLCLSNTEFIESEYNKIKNEE